MKNNVVRLGKWALRGATIFAVSSAGAVTITGSGEDTGDTRSSSPDIGLSGELRDGAFSAELPAKATAGSAALWQVVHPLPGNQHGKPSTVGNGVVDATSEITIPDFDNHTPSVSYRGETPPSGGTDFSAWRSSNGAPSNPEDWLFQMQYNQDLNNQQSEPEPFLPVPEPASGLIVVMGLAGLCARRKYAGQAGRA